MGNDEVAVSFLHLSVPPRGMKIASRSRLCGLALLAIILRRLWQVEMNKRIMRRYIDDSNQPCCSRTEMGFIMSSRRPSISLVSLVTAVIVFAFLGSLGSAQLFRFGESRRRTQCANNLKQLALAVHSYHDANFQMPPLATDDGHWTWAALLLPYLGEEELGTYKKLTIHMAAKTKGNIEVVRSFKNPRFLCPSRRITAKRKDGDYKGGQPSDYMAVSTTAQLKWGFENNGPIIYRATPPTDTQHVRSRVTFGSIIDGLSNTLMFGEKHMLKEWFGGEFDEPVLVALNNQNTIRIGSDVQLDKDGKEVAKLRGLAKKDDKDNWKFGSAHPGICQFALCDGSVRAIKNTVAPRTLRWACGRNDQRVYELP